MVCVKLQRGELAERYLNGQLDPATQEQLELHVLDCPNCQQTVELLQAVRDELTAPAHGIRVDAPTPRGGSRWSWVAVAALVVIASVGVAALILTRTRSVAFAWRFVKGHVRHRVPKLSQQVQPRRTRGRVRSPQITLEGTS